MKVIRSPSSRIGSGSFDRRWCAGRGSSHPEGCTNQLCSHLRRLWRGLLLHSGDGDLLEGRRPRPLRNAYLQHPLQHRPSRGQSPSAGGGRADSWSLRGPIPGLPPAAPHACRPSFGPSRSATYYGFGRSRPYRTRCTHGDWLRHAARLHPCRLVLRLEHDFARRVRSTSSTTSPLVRSRPKNRQSSTRPSFSSPA